MRHEAAGLRLSPCIPQSWPGFTMRRNFRGNIVHIDVQNPHGVSRGVASLTVDGKPVAGDLVPAEWLKQNSKIVAVLG